MPSPAVDPTTMPATPASHGSTRTTAAESPAHIGSVTMAQGTALYVGAVLGTGVLALPALAAQAAGPASLLAWFGLIVLSIPLAATFAALAARYPDAGGVATFVRRAFGPRASAITGWWFYCSVPIGAPVAGLFGGFYVSSALGAGTTTAYVVAAAIVAAAIGANIVGVRLSGRLQLGFAALLATLLVTAISLAAPHSRLDNLHPFMPHGWASVGTAASLIMWSFTGWETVTNLAGEFRDPQRDLKRATTLALVVVSALYLAVATTSVAVLGPQAGTSQAPLSDLLARGLGESMHTVAAIVAVILTFGTINAYIASGAKLGSALGRDGVLPRWLARGSETGEVPRRSLAAMSVGVVLTFDLLIVGTVETAPLLRLVTAGFVAVYALGCAAGVRLLPRRSFGRASAIVALVLVVGMLVMAGPYLLWPAVITAAALGYLTVTNAERR